MLSRVSVPDEDVATIRAAHHKVIPPETRLLNHGPGVAMALVHHLDRGSPDILSLTLLHLSPFFSPAEQLLDPSRGGASMKNRACRAMLMKNLCTTTLQHITTQQQLNIILVQHGKIFKSYSIVRDNI